MAFASTFVMAVVASASLFLLSSCVNEQADSEPVFNDSAFIYGTITVSLQEAFPPYWDNETTVSARFYDNPSPDPVVWKEVAVSGDCRVIKPEAPFCDPGCGTTGLCTAEGTCVPFPKPVNVGAITVQGIRKAAGGNSFTMNPVLGAYRPSGVTFSWPPYAEGDLITFNVAGSSEAPRFSVSGQGLYLPRLLNDTIVLDGHAIDLQWVAPGSGAGPSRFLALIDVSHHGGLKGAIECVTEDDGSLQIAGSLVNELKALGVSGYPQLDLIRRASTVVEGQGVGLVLEARTLTYVGVPGLISCREDDECPGTQTCQADFKCQ